MEVKTTWCDFCGKQVDKHEKMAGRVKVSVSYGDARQADEFVSIDIEADYHPECYEQVKKQLDGIKTIITPAASELGQKQPWNEEIHAKIFGPGVVAEFEAPDGTELIDLSIEDGIEEGRLRYGWPTPDKVTLPDGTEVKVAPVVVSEAKGEAELLHSPDHRGSSSMDVVDAKLDEIKEPEDCK